MALTISDNIMTAIPKFIAAEALPVLEANLFMGNLVNRNYEGALANSGDTVDIPVTPTMTANNIAETGTVQTQQLTLGNIPVTLTEHVEATFQISDVAKALTSLDLVRTYIQPAMLTIAERIESDLLNLGPLATFNPAQGASNTAPTEAVIDAIETAFFKARVPANEPKLVAVSADFYAALRQIPRFTETQTIGSGDAMITGEFGRLKNLNFFRSQLIVPVSSTTNNLAFTSSGIALVVRRIPLPPPGMGTVGAYAEYKNFALRVLMSYNASMLAPQVTVDVLYGVSALRNQALMQVLS
jgi:N4-gp56 family major capsid protein